MQHSHPKMSSAACPYHSSAGADDLSGLLCPDLEAVEQFSALVPSQGPSATHGLGRVRVSTLLRLMAAFLESSRLLCFLLYQEFSPLSVLSTVC